MKRLSIHIRLTVYYLCSLAVIVTAFAIGCWYAMKASMYHSVDRDLRYRMRAVVPFLQSHSLNTPEEFRKTFENSPDSSIVGVFVQITDAKSSLLYQSEILAVHHVPVLPPGNADGSISWSSAKEYGWTIRAASERIRIDGEELNVHIIEPLTDLLDSLHQLTFYLSLLIPLALLVTMAAGYWIGRRALAPVEQIRQTADAMHPMDLTTRLEVPETNDELGRLARTLNSMLSRIEAGFRSVERFTADASHELRAPLAYIITTGDVALRRPRSHEELEAVVGKILAEARRMSTLIENMLTLARGDASRVTSQKEAVNLNILIEEVADQIRTAFSAKGLQFYTVLPQNSVQVIGIEPELRSLILILLDNAMKYTDSGSVRLTLTAEPSIAKLIVTDTGIGIEPDAQPLIFDRFWRADKVRSRAGGGAGLGLSIAAQILKRHHGTISVNSALGKGSSFTVALPLQIGD